MIQVSEGPRGTVLALRGSFGAAEADRVNELLRDRAPQEPVTIDFREVRLFHDTAIARLASELVEAHRHVSLLGLSEHHHRLLRYIGLSSMPAA